MAQFSPNVLAIHLQTKEKKWIRNSIAICGENALLAVQVARKIIRENSKPIAVEASVSLLESLVTFGQEKEVDTDRDYKEFHGAMLLAQKTLEDKCLGKL